MFYLPSITSIFTNLGFISIILGLFSFLHICYLKNYKYKQIIVAEDEILLRYIKNLSKEELNFLRMTTRKLIQLNSKKKQDRSEIIRIVDEIEKEEIQLIVDIFLEREERKKEISTIIKRSILLFILLGLLVIIPFLMEFFLIYTEFFY